MKEIWENRALIRTFAISDLIIRYRGSVLGFFWTILEPLLMLTILYLVFTNVFRSEIENYALYLLVGIVMWNFFVRSTNFAMSSFISKAGIITKTYFPREILPISSCITAFLISVFEFIVLFLFFVVFQFFPPATIIILPGLLGLEFLLALGFSFGLSVLLVRYRDVQYIWGVITYAGFFTVPIFYSIEIIPEKFKQIYLLNPMAQIIDMSHNVVLYNVIPDIWNITYTIFITGVSLAVGYLIFRSLNAKVIEEL